MTREERRKVEQRRDYIQAYLESPNFPYGADWLTSHEEIAAEFKALREQLHEAEELLLDITDLLGPEETPQ
jgi:hypothetical protein